MPSAIAQSFVKIVVVAERSKKKRPRVECIDQAGRKKLCAFTAAGTDRGFAYKLVGCKHGGIIEKEGWAINTNVHGFSELSLE